ncbi:uncharacterized protein SOCEGT47_038550 [Sorangium cellulosum]|uniref:Uncharacterized protein n=1 Tax=Sorangium cellulosum TaxID=56 RepID=A0A4V0NDN9_SORCE|nr:hypothetical protein [Sorangium cellulosum]AUX23332.1 uncharacterized protein SOCEGT47_038550 [Sorangium cellulosum]
MPSSALDRFLQIASGPPSEKRWSRLFVIVGEWPDDAATAEGWTDRAEAALASWPDHLRVAVMSEREIVEPDTWIWGIAPAIGPAPWLRLVRALWTAASEVLAAPDGGGWEQSGFPAVRRFHVRDKLSSFAEAARAVARLPALSTLDLSSAVLFPPTPDTIRVGWAELLQAAARSHVTDLNIARVPLSPALMDELAASDIARGLIALNVSSSRTQFGDEGMAALARWPAGGSLQTLRAAHDGLTDRGAMELWDSGALHAVRVLDLSGNALSDAFVSALARHDSQSLIELDLHGNQLTDRSAEGFSRASLPALRKLRVTENRLTSAGARRLLAWAATRPGLVCRVQPLR